MTPSSAPRVIKKYSNRRLYDTAESRYITLEDLARLVRDGAEVRVVDANTNEDLTQPTLTQILIEGRGAAAFLSPALLTQLIRMGDDALGEFLGRYLHSALELYLQARQGAQAIAPYNPFANVPFMATNAMARLMTAIPGWGNSYPGPQQYGPPPSQYGSPPAAPPYTPEPPPNNAGVDELRREFESLKASLRQSPELAPAAPRRRPSKKR